MQASSSRDAGERAAYLYSSAQSALLHSPALARVLLVGLDELTANGGDAQPPLPARAVQRACAKCFSPLVPGFSCRVTSKRHPRRPAARRHSLRIVCERCGHASLFAMPAPASARAAIAEADLAPAAARAGKAPAPAPGKKRAPSAPAPAAAKPRRKAVAPTRPAAPPPASADTLFGFDFVPL